MALINTNNSITVADIMQMMKATNMSQTFATQILGIDSAVDNVDRATITELLKTGEQAELITFVERVLRIFHSSTGTRNVKRGATGETIEIMVFPEDNDVFFYILVRSHAIRQLVFCVQDVYFEIPVNNLPTGMGIITQFNGIPNAALGVENVKGEIADFIGDYLDEYGVTDEFVPRL